MPKPKGWGAYMDDILNKQQMAVMAGAFVGARLADQRIPGITEPRIMEIANHFVSKEWDFSEPIGKVWSRFMAHVGGYGYLLKYMDFLDVQEELDPR